MRTHNEKRTSARLLLGGLLLLTARPAPGWAEPAQCGARVLLTDPAADLRDIAIAPGVATAIGETARVLVAPEPDAPKLALAVWENGRGQFRKVDAGAAPVPPGAVRLHVFLTQGDSDEAAAFYASLSGEFRDAPKPSFLSGKRKRKPRAVDDNVLAYQDGSLPAARKAAGAPSRPDPAPATGVLACAFDFSGLSSGGEPPQ